MKYIITTIAIVITGLITGTNAQELGKDRVAIGTGYSLTNQALKSLGESGSSWNISAEASRHWGKWDVTLTGYISGVTINRIRENLQYYNADVSYYGVLAGGNYSWYQKPKLRFFSGAAIGVYDLAINYSSNVTNSDIESLSGFTYQVTALGCEQYYGSRNRFGVWAKIGFGLQGLANFGIAYRW